MTALGAASEVRRSPPQEPHTSTAECGALPVSGGARLVMNTHTERNEPVAKDAESAVQVRKKSNVHRQAAAAAAAEKHDAT